MTALLPCECGGDPTRWSTDIDGLICRIICRSCGAQTTIFGDWPSAEQCWNRRAATLPTREEVADAILANFHDACMDVPRCTQPGCKCSMDAADAVLRLLGANT